MKRFTKILMAAALSSLLLVGCSTTEATEIANETVVIKHMNGETQVPINPTKVAVFDMASLDTMDALGIEVELALPLGSLTTDLEKYSNQISAGDIKDPNFEALFEFAPELIIISGRQADFYEELSEIAPTLYLGTDRVEYLEDFKANVMSIATIFEKQALAQIKINELEEKIAEINKKASLMDESALILLTNNGKISAYGSGSRFGMIHDVFGIPQADGDIEVSTHGQEVGYEYISKINPDIIYVVDRASIAGGAVGANETLDNPMVSSTKAGKNGKIVNLDPEHWYLSSEGLSSFEAMISEIEKTI